MADRPESQKPRLTASAGYHGVLFAPLPYCIQKTWYAHMDSVRFTELHSVVDYETLRRPSHQRLQPGRNMGKNYEEQARKEAKREGMDKAEGISSRDSGREGRGRGQEKEREAGSRHETHFGFSFSFAFFYTFCTSLSFYTIMFTVTVTHTESTAHSTPL